MSKYDSLPLEIQCTCGQLLFQGLVTVRHDGTITSHDLIATSINMTCETCSKHLHSVEDDFVRALNALEQISED